MADIRKPKTKTTKKKQAKIEEKKKFPTIIFSIICAIIILELIYVGYQYYTINKLLNSVTQSALNNNLSTEVEDITVPSENNEEIAENIPTTLNPAEAKEIIQTKSQETITALQNKDLKKISTLMSPEENLVFSPYARFNENNQTFTQEEVTSLFSNNTQYYWGKYNGIASDAIKLTFAQYWKEFIYDQDFAKAEKIVYNQNLGVGAIKNNALQFFPGSIVVEYHFSGFDEEFDGMDWQSLRLIFAERDGEWYLKAISHDEWTI